MANYMQEIIDQLKVKVNELEVEKDSTAKSGQKAEYGSHEQTRAMLFEGIFAQAIANIEAANRQLEIIARELY